MSKTPYEIRYNLLEMAKSMCENNWNAQRDAVMMEWNIQTDIARETGQPIPSIPKIKPLVEDDFIRVAETLNVFVSKNN